MMRATSRYALKSLAILAERGDRRPTLSGEIPKGEAIPKKFLEAILRELKQHGIPSAQRGRGGGYALRRKPEEITLAAVIRVLDSPIAPLPCLSRTAYQPCEECKSQRVCGVRLVLEDLYEATANVEKRTTLADLVRRTTKEASKAAALTVSYSI